MFRHPGMTIVPAVRSARSPRRARTLTPPVARTAVRSSEHTENRYHGTFISGRGKPKISTAIPNSKVHKPS